VAFPDIIAAGACCALVGITRCYHGRATLRGRIGIGGLRPFGIGSGRDGARGGRLLVAGVVAGSGGIDTVAVDRLVAVGVRLARSFGGGTVLRALAAAATRGTSTFVHAAIVE